MKIQLSKNIRLFRKEKGYTQEQLAEALGVTVGAVSKWETGLSVPDIQLIVEMADFSMLPLMYFLDINGEKEVWEHR